MESIDLALDDIFDGGLEEEDLAVPPPLPDLDDDTAAEGEHDGALNADGEETDATARDKTPKSAVKKRVLRPQPKLDAERLQSERGLPMLPKLFTNTKFKGKGHEAEDLKLVMGKLEHWAHRLFPKLTFDDFSARLEKLGHTKPVQTCIKRIRLDMPVADGDFTGNPNDDNMSGDEENGADAPHGSVMDVEEAYEEMLQQERQQVALQKTATPGGPKANESSTAAAGSSSDESSPRQLPRGTQSKSADMASPAMSSTGLSPQGTQQAKVGSSQPSMTSDQLARIERNKQVAMQKRAARLGIPVTALASPKPSSDAPSVALQDTTSDADDTDTPIVTVTAPTPPCHRVAMTTDAQTPDKDDVKSGDESLAVIENTGTPDKSRSNCAPYRQKEAPRLDVPDTSFASPKPSSKQPTDLSGTMTDIDNDDAPTLTVTAPSPPRHLSSAVTMTTNTEANMRGSDSCDTDALTTDKDSEKSDENSAVTKNTRGQDETVNKCTPDGATHKSSSQLGIPKLSIASPKPPSTDALQGTTSDINNGDTPTLTVTAPTPPRHPALAVTMTTDIQSNTPESNSCNATAEREGVK